MFGILRRRSNEHLKRAEVLLQEASLARVEHQAAAEHHGALAQMYSERVARLEREIYGSRPLPWKDEPLAPESSDKVRHYPFKRLDRVEQG